MSGVGDGEGQTLSGVSSTGLRPQRSCDRRDIVSLMSTCHPITLKFMDICYRVKLERKSNDSGCITRVFNSGPTSHDRPMSEERTILNGVTGMVAPGEILAILGPSGSGKSTLLTALAGRLHNNTFTGSVLANDRKLSKPVLRRTGFVTQDDVLYPHLTVKETLVFCSLLRLPKTLSKREKTQVAESVISELGLGKCENAIIGNSFIRGISGGERKRVCIGHEMLVNPSLLLLDEPTSGLDSTAAHRLTLILTSLASKGKTIVTSMHQPSSRVYQMFHSVLVLSEGRCVYFGKGSDAMSYFSSLGFSPSFPMNPADFLLDLANGVHHSDSQNEGEKPNVRQTLVASYDNLLAPKVKEACMEMPSTTTRGSARHREDTNKNTVSTTSWFNQFRILMQRSLKERKHESFNSLRVFQVIAASILAGIMWWQSDVRDIQDRLGLLFFIAIFWGVFPSFNAVFAFTQERVIFIKERASGMYTLSSYFMARIIGDMPMELILPTVFMTVLYWMAGLKHDIGAFLLTWLVLLGHVLVGQGLGLFVGAMIMDAKQATTVVTVVMLAFVLIGGYYVHTVPVCISWIKYTSITFYCYRLLIAVQYGEGNMISSMLGCSSHDGNSANCKIVEADVKGQMNPNLAVGILLSMFFGYRFLAYVALRRAQG